MNSLRTSLAIVMLALTLGGCSTFKELTGSNDNSVLPGQREDVLPPDQQTARDPVITGEDTSSSDIPDSTDGQTVDQEGANPEVQ